MRIPDKKILENSKSLPEKTIKISNITEINYFDYEFLDKEKDTKKFIKKTESVIRKSYEYKNYINYLKENIDMNSCTFFKNLNRSDGFSIEIHHAPFTLYDIVQIILNKFISTNRHWTQLELANEVMELHYRGNVGLIPLSITVHKAVHNGDIFIPIQNVYGDIRNFVLTYKDYISEELLSVLKNNLEMSQMIIDNNYQPSILEKNITYLDIEGNHIIEKIPTREQEIG